MVIRLLSLLLFIPFFLFTAEFTANVSNSQVPLGENLTVTFTLKDASAKGIPSLGILKKLFFVSSQQQSSQIAVINGEVTSVTTWKVSLLPQKKGEITIPPITVETSEGTLSSKPLSIQVLKEVAPSSNSLDNKDLIIKTEMSNSKPYKNEPSIFTVTLTSKLNLANIQVQKINIDGAILEAHGEPKIYEKTLNGIRVVVIEFSYLITPLTVGSLKIPSMIIHGEIPFRKQNRRNSFFDDDFDFFSMMHGFDQLKPFSIATEEAVLNVQPPVADIVPWLPASSLEIEEIWNESQIAQVGEPLNLGFVMKALGVKSSQLPSLHEQLANDKSFKIYADNPELKDQVHEGIIKSTRKEQYTLIPQQEGELTLPKISITWWDTATHEKVITTIPERTLHVLPAIVKIPTSIVSEIPETLTKIDKEPFFVNPTIYVTIGGLVILFILAIFWVIMLQKKIQRLIKPKDIIIAKNEPMPLPSIPKIASQPKKEKKEKLPDLNPT
jgi:BatD DUF11 like domain